MAVKLRFTMDNDPMPSADEVLKILGEGIEYVEEDKGVYEVSFDPGDDSEEDSIWRMICEIGVHYPGATLAE